MKIHEYQAKQLLKKYGVATPEGKVAFSAEEAVEAARSLNTATYVVKAQIHAGGRGKAGGVRLVRSPEEVRQAATDLLFSTLVTHQTSKEGRVVKRLLVEAGCAIQKEYYVSLAIDPATSKVVLIASAEGGTEIEEVAEKTPECIVKKTIDPQIGLRSYEIRLVAKQIHMPVQLADQLVTLLKGMYCAFVENDCSILEINPLVQTADGNLLALDAKINFDANALFRNPEIVALRDPEEEDLKEIEASKYDLSYISLNGNIGCLVNGAGLAMATMDMIKYYGGEPANFLDVGGSASAEKVANAFRIILSDGAVKGILVNIFGGIMKCDVIAEGIVKATQTMQLNVPVVVRLNGTNMAIGKEILAKSGLNITPADSLMEAVKKITAMART